MSQTIVAFVPMRHSSERVKGKNYRMLGGQPLYHHVVRALLDVAAITEIVIDTDSPLITEDVAEPDPAADPTTATRAASTGGQPPR